MNSATPGWTWIWASCLSAERATISCAEPSRSTPWMAAALPAASGSIISIAALISVVIIVAVTAVGTVNTTFNAITTITLASPPGPKSRPGPGPTASRRRLRQTGLDMMSLVIAGDPSSHHLWSGRRELTRRRCQSSRHVAGLAAHLSERTSHHRGQTRGRGFEATLKSPHGLFAAITFAVGILGLLFPIVMLLKASW